MSVQPTNARKALIDALITSLKSAGVWAKLDVLWIPAAHDSQAGRLNWKSPGTFTLAEVSSPTFTLIHEYHGGRLPLVHMDLYRIESSADLAPLGFDDYLAGDGIVAIEWGGKFAEELPPHTVRLEFSIEGSGRLIQIQP